MSKFKLTPEENNCVMECVVSMIKKDTCRLEVLKEILELGVDVTFSNDLAFRMAAKKGNLPVLKMLIDKGANVAGSAGTEALIEATSNNHIDVINLLIENEVIFDDKTVKKVIEIAFDKGYADIIKVFKDFQIDDIKEKFYKAIRKGHVEVVKLLIESGFDVTSKEVEFYLLKHAVEVGNLEIFKLLVEAGANVRADDDGILDCICESKGSVEIAKYLYGINPAMFIKGKDYKLKFAIMFHNPEVAIFLVQIGADVTFDSNYAIKEASYRGYTELVKILIENGANINACSNTPIMSAVREGHVEIVKMLIEAGVAIEAINHDDFQYAIKVDYIDVVKYLIEKGIDVTANDNSALKYACSTRCSKEIIALLLEAGADPNAENCSALIIAARNNRLDILIMLLQAINKTK